MAGQGQRRGGELQLLDLPEEVLQLILPRVKLTGPQYRDAVSLTCRRFCSLLRSARRWEALSWGAGAQPAVLQDLRALQGLLPQLPALSALTLPRLRHNVHFELGALGALSSLTRLSLELSVKGSLRELGRCTQLVALRVAFPVPLMDSERPQDWPRALSYWWRGDAGYKAFNYPQKSRNEHYADFSAAVTKLTGLRELGVFPDWSGRRGDYQPLCVAWLASMTGLTSLAVSPRLASSFDLRPLTRMRSFCLCLAHPDSECGDFWRQDQIWHYYRTPPSLVELELGSYVVGGLYSSGVEMFARMQRLTMQGLKMHAELDVSNLRGLIYLCIELIGEEYQRFDLPVGLKELVLERVKTDVDWCVAPFLLKCPLGGLTALTHLTVRSYEREAVLTLVQSLPRACLKSLRLDWTSPEAVVRAEVAGEDVFHVTEAEAAVFAEFPELRRGALWVPEYIKGGKVGVGGGWQDLDLTYCAGAVRKPVHPFNRETFGPGHSYVGVVESGKYYYV